MLALHAAQAGILSGSQGLEQAEAPSVPEIGLFKQIQGEALLRLYQQPPISCRHRESARPLASFKLSMVREVGHFGVEFDDGSELLHAETDVCILSSSLVIA